MEKAPLAAKCAESDLYNHDNRYYFAIVYFDHLLLLLLVVGIVAAFGLVASYV